MHSQLITHNTWIYRKDIGGAILRWSQNRYTDKLLWKNVWRIKSTSNTNFQITSVETKIYFCTNVNHWCILARQIEFRVARAWADLCLKIFTRCIHYTFRLLPNRKHCLLYFALLHYAKNLQTLTKERIFWFCFVYALWIANLIPVHTTRVASNVNVAHANPIDFYKCTLVVLATGSCNISALSLSDTIYLYDIEVWDVSNPNLWRIVRRNIRRNFYTRREFIPRSGNEKRQ